LDRYDPSCPVMPVISARFMILQVYYGVA